MKNLKNLGKALSKAEQKTIIGGKYDAHPNPPLCNCYTITCAGGSIVDGTYGIQPCTNPRAYPISFSAIIPTPACCE